MIYVMIPWPIVPMSRIYPRMEKTLTAGTCYSTMEDNSKTNMFTRSAKIVQSGEIENRQTTRNSYDSNKSMGETDSGILSDSTEHRRTKEFESSVQNLPYFPEFDKLQKTSFSFDTESVGSEIAINESLNLGDDYANKINDGKLINPTRLINCNKQKNVRELTEQRKANNRQQIMKKLRNLKKCSRTGNLCHNISNHQDVNARDNKSSCTVASQKRLNDSSEYIVSDDYIPKKIPRIAHVPKRTTTEQSKPLNDNAILKDCSVKSIINTGSNIDKRSSVESVIDLREEKIVILNKLSDQHKSLNPDCVANHSHIAMNPIKEIASDATTLSYDVQSNVILNSDKPQMNGTLNFDTTLAKSTILEEISSMNCNVEKIAHCNFVLSDTVVSNDNSHVRSDDSNDIIRNEDTYLSTDSLLKFESTMTIVSNNESKMKDSLMEAYDHIGMEDGVVDTNAVDTSANTANESALDSPLERMRKYMAKRKNTSIKNKDVSNKLHRIRIMTDKFVEKQLQRLIEGPWETSLHCNVIEELKATCSSRIIAKCIVDFLSKEEQCTESLDNSHTPPAPLMTKGQQRITALVVDLEESKPMLYHFVQTGIEYRLFKLNQTIKRSVLESLSRIYTSLARIKKDREKVRIFCCDALYCFGLNSVPVLYAVLTTWPEIFPNYETSKDLLPKCIAHIIGMQKAARDFPKLNALKNLISKFYQYPSGSVTKDVLNELLTSLEHESNNGVHTAIILLAKKEGPAWTYKHIVRGAILPMIINKKHPSMYRAFCLLGNLMRAFPLEDENNSVGEISEQLCALINSGEGSAEQQEGVISALLSLSRHKFDEILRSLMMWTPIEPLHHRTIEQFGGIFKMRQPSFWKAVLKKYNKQSERAKRIC